MPDIQEQIEKALPRIAIRMQNELILAAPVDTGRLRNSIKVSADEDGIIIFMVDYAKFVEFGSPPHVIKPKDRKALRFKGSRKGKKFVFAKEVKHPGSRPNPFIRNTIQNKLRNIIIEEIIR